jgi:dolichyl-diphosphooligosaccharide--protein glycosyltransferase
MSSNETAAYKIMTDLNVDYVLVIFGGVMGYSGDDINKFLWMVRIAEGEHPNDIRESDYFTERGEFRVDAEGSPTLLNCLVRIQRGLHYWTPVLRFTKLYCHTHLF